MTPVQDSRLPALGSAFEPAVLRERFTGLWRNEGAAIEITACTRADTKYEPGSSCVVAYDLTGSGPDGTCATVGVVEVTPAGAGHRLFLDDPRLPGIRRAMDARGVLARAQRLRAAEPPTPGDEAAWCVRYKPGTSCVIRYGTRSAARSLLYAKLFAADGLRHTAVLEQLFDLAALDAALPRVPRPMGYWDELSALVQLPLEGNSLRAMALGQTAEAPVAERLLQAAGEAMAEFHARVPTQDRRRTLDEDLDDAARHARLFAALVPELEGAFDHGVRRARDAASRLPATAVTAVHGAIRLDQFIVDRDSRIGLVDFDGVASGDPCRDVGNLLAYLDWRAIRVPQERAIVAGAERGWLNGYTAAARHPVAERSLAVHRATSMLKIAGRSLRSLRSGEWQHLPALLDRARGLLG